MPSSLPKYSGLISEHQLSILDEFIALHDGISKARVLGRLLEAWHDAGKPILGDRDRTLRDRLLQFEQLDLDALVAQKVQEYLDIHLDDLVNNVVENKLRPLSNIDNEKTIIDNNLVSNKLLSKDLQDDESLAESNIADDGELKVVTENEEEVFSLSVQGEQLEDKQKKEYELVSNKDVNEVDSLNRKVSDKDVELVDHLNKKDINKDTNQVDDLNREDSNKGIDLVDNLNKKDVSQDTNQVKKVSKENISPTKKGQNKVGNQVSNKVIENDEEKPKVKDSSMSIIKEENPASQLVISLDKSKVNNQADVSHIPADFLALPKGKVGTKMLAKALGFSSSARASELANGKKKPPFKEFWDYMKLKTTTKTDKNGKQVNSYQWTKIR
ncbi:hypothetical protein [Cyanobacterium aponinum]|uniref:Uncharacterized protein n=1 Tax=Cyanobacterium aponinum 0216 TaxID=2676140 RepID=A0A844GV32_9CHRO|nr:hypothetical protein [Cyanobacterium aponinum]MTF40317.1 hypothetical protein [Cyanobacterium aponinum 0216]